MGGIFLSNIFGGSYSREKIEIVLSVTSLFGVMIMNIVFALSTYRGYNALSEIADDNTYILADYTDLDYMEYLFANENEYVDSMRKLYSSIISSQDYYTYTAYSYTDVEQKDGIEIKQYTTDANFLEINRIQLLNE